MFPDELMCLTSWLDLWVVLGPSTWPSISRCEENHNYETCLYYQKDKAVGKRAKEVQNDMNLLGAEKDQ